MFLHRNQIETAAGQVDLAFTDRHDGVSAAPFNSLDLSRSREGHDDELRTNLARLAAAFDVEGFATMTQVHGNEVHQVDAPGPVSTPCDALFTTEPDVALCVRVADCVPVVLADVSAGVVAVAHAGRRGVVAGVVPSAVQAMHERGAETIHAWVGPHVCGGCYEVPEAMREEVAAVEPAAYACTTWGTPSVDLGAAVVRQLEQVRCEVNRISVCTQESPDLYSHRRDGASSGRFGAIIVRRGAGHG